jgi:hypothetical protein
MKYQLMIRKTDKALLVFTLEDLNLAKKVYQALIPLPEDVVSIELQQVETISISQIDNEP